MEFATSLYKGGEQIPANTANYETAKQLGCVCSLCKESVFWVKEHQRGDRTIRAVWSHYRISPESKLCDRRALSKEGREILEKLQPKARNQRLKLFNRRFWEIVSYRRVVPRNLRATCLRYMPEETLNKMIRHCWDRWDVKAILKVLPERVKAVNEVSLKRELAAQHPAFQEVAPDMVDQVIQDFAVNEFSILRFKILSEAIAWLGTQTAKEAFGKLIQLSCLDCLEVFDPNPVHSQNVADMAITTLVLTDWEAAIASLDNQTRAIGFGK